jgi:membrane protein required for colicin V production
MQSYDVLMLLVLVAAALWGFWKGFVWQLASLVSIFFSYFLAFGLREQVAKLIDAAPPFNTFAAMGIVYLFSSLVIWIGTAFVGKTLETFKLKDFDRQLGATFGVAKGVIFCLLITMFAVTLLGQRQQERICTSLSGKYMAKILRSSGGLIPKELHAVVDPYLMPLQQRLEQQQAAQPDQWAQQPPAAGDWTQQPAPNAQQWPNAQQMIEQGAVAWNQYVAPHLQQQPPPQQYQYGYQPAPQYQQPNGYYDPRYAQPQPQYAPPAYDPRYAPDPRYQQPQYQAPQYQPQYPDPRYADPRGYQPPADNRGYSQPPPQYQPQPQYAPQPQYSDGYYR